MVWKINLSNAITTSGYQPIEICAWTNLAQSKLSNMKNRKHLNFTCEEFISLRLLFKKTHVTFLTEIFGENYFDNIRKIEYHPKLTGLGQLVTERHKFEILPKKELVKNAKLKSSRIDYTFFEDDSKIRIEELTKIELALGETLGSLCNLRFSDVKLNSEEEYQVKLDELREYNRQANERRSK